MKDDACVCGLRYGDFRTGLSYHDVSEGLWAELTYNGGTRRWKTRHTILGRWRQVKLEMWEWHIQECEQHFNEDS